MFIWHVPSVKMAYKPTCGETLCKTCLWHVSGIANLTSIIIIISSPEPLGSQDELIVYPLRRRPSSVVNNFKHLLLRNHWADQSQILCGASLGRGMIFCSRHLGHMTKMAATPIYGKNPSKIFSRTGGRFSRNLVCSIGDSTHHSFFKWWPWSDLDLFYGKVNFGNLGFSIGKS